VSELSFVRDSPADGPPQSYALIPTGIRSMLDLRAAIANDEALEAHFADFDLAHASFRVLSHDDYAYVSYRKNGQILWTKTPVLLHKGEFVLDDGARLVRARCGNRIAYLPQLPTEPPGIGGLELPASSLEPPPDVPAAPEIPPAAKVYVPPPPPPPCCNSPIVPILYVPPGGGPPWSPPGSPLRAPEPPTIALLGTACAAGLLLRRLRRR